MVFEHQHMVGWGDLDANGHLRNTAYLDKSADLRMLYFASNGFPMSAFAEHGIGPVVQSDEIEYFREFRLLEPIRITLIAAGLSEDGARFRLRNEFYRPDGRLAARVTSRGGWMNIGKRRLTAPPPALKEALLGLSRSDDYGVLSDLVEKP